MRAQKIETKAVCFLKWYSQMRNISNEGNWGKKIKNGTTGKRMIPLPECRR